MSHLTKSEQSLLQSQLQDEAASLKKRLAEDNHFGMSETLSETTGELSTYDNHPADIGSEVFERGKDMALNDQAENYLYACQDALDRMQSGDYGHCSECGRPIPFERLQAVPTTMKCIQHAPKRHIQTRPSEESLMQQPLDDEDEAIIDHSNRPDRMDSWEAVYSWGNSNSPAIAVDWDFDDYVSFRDQEEGFVEPIETFLATDIYGNDVSVVRNHEYRTYMENGEGDPMLWPYTSENGDGDGRN